MAKRYYIDLSRKDVGLVSYFPGKELKNDLDADWIETVLLPAIRSFRILEAVETSGVCAERMANNYSPLHAKFRQDRVQVIPVPFYAVRYPRKRFIRAPGTSVVPGNALVFFGKLSKLLAPNLGYTHKT